MDKIYIGYVQGVHGLRGDLKIKARFENPEKVFIKDEYIFLNEEEHKITNTKFYKGFYLVTIDNLKDINLVEKYIGFDVYASRESLNLDKNYILDDLYNMRIIQNGEDFGFVKEIIQNSQYSILVIDYEKQYMIPLIDEYVKCIDLDTNSIEVVNVRSLII